MTILRTLDQARTQIAIDRPRPVTKINQTKASRSRQRTVCLQGVVAQDKVAAKRTKLARIEAESDLAGIGSKFSEEAAKDLDAARR